MTVLSPSLPPPISRTTRTVPSLSCSAARAVAARNCGTAGAQASNVEVFSERARKSRRVSMADSFGRIAASGLCERVLRQRQQGVRRLADALLPHGLLG